MGPKRLTKKMYNKPRTLCLFMFLVLSLLLSCRLRPNVQGKGEAFLQGLWAQDSIPHKKQLLNYTHHQIKFTCDSFYVDFTTHAKINYYQENCFNNGIWKEYAKGVYALRGDTLFLQGDFTKASYKQKISGCYRNGRYVANFLVKHHTSAQLLLISLNDQSQLFLNLKQRITCVPKEL